MRKTKLDIIDVVKKGVNIVISAENLTKLDLIDIIKSSPQGTEITINDTFNKTKLDLIDIAKAAKHVSLTLHL